MTERQKLSDFAGKIDNLFGLQEQGRELVAFVAKTTGCKPACLLFLDIDGEDFTVLSRLPKSKANPFYNLRLSQQSPVVSYLRRGKKVSTREKLTALPDFRRFLKGNAGKTNLNSIKILAPLISRKRLIGILLLGEKHSGEYSQEDCSLIQSVTDRLSPSMEKEYLREQLGQQKEELSVINRASVIMASSLDIQQIFDSFIKELRKIADIDWSAITLIADRDICLLALSSDIGSAWKAGQQMSAKGTATEWVVKHQKTLIEPDLIDKSRFITAESHIKQGVRSIAYLALKAGGRAIGSLIVASRQPNAYGRRQINFFEELVSQITMPIEHSQLYAEIVEKARVDTLTGLFNRRSFDEVMTN